MKRFIKDDAGAASIEYGLIVALLSTAIITSVLVMGDGLRGLYDSIAGTLVAAFASIG